jgi:hypothetical protein
LANKDGGGESTKQSKCSSQFSSNCSRRKYIWTEALPAEAINKWLPFNGEQIADALREALTRNGPRKEEAEEEETISQIGQILCQQFGHLLGQFWRELRRLSAILAKCTRRDIGTAILVGQLIKS